MIPALVGVALLLLTFYWAYKKFRGPVYIPGSVAKLATNHPEHFYPVHHDEKSDGQQGSDAVASDQNNYWIMSRSVRLFYFKPEKIGNAGPNSNTTTVLLGIHGGPCIAPNKPWALSPSLGQFFLYHARGCGMSSRPVTEWPSPGRMWPGMKIVEQELGLGVQIQDMERIRRNHLSVDQLVLIGHSFGGFLATLYAAEFPHRVKALILLAPAGVLQLPPPKGSSPDLFQTIREKIKERGNEEHVSDFDNFFRRYFDFGSLPKSNEDSLARLHGEFALHWSRASGDDMSREALDVMIEDKKVGGMATYAMYLSMGIEHNYKPQLQRAFREAKFPVLIVHGDKDLSPPSASREYQELFPISSFKMVPSANHFLFDDPKVSEYIKEVLSQT